MNFIGKDASESLKKLNELSSSITTVTDRVGEAFDESSEVIFRLTKDVSTTTNQMQAMAKTGMIAFALISLVAVTALLIASKK